MKLFGALLPAFFICSGASAQEDTVLFRKSSLPNRLSARTDSVTQTNSRFNFAEALIIEDVVATPVGDDGTIRDTLVRTEQQQGALTFVRNTFNQNYIDNIVSGRASDALDLSDDASQKIAAYEGALFISRALAASPLAHVYAKISQNFRTVRNYLMFRVSPERDGALGFESASDYGKRTNFLEFRLAPSTRHGIQPRLRLGERVSMSYDFDEKAPILEYNFNF